MSDEKLNQRLKDPQPPMSYPPTFKYEAATAADLYFAGLRLLGFVFEPEAERQAMGMLAQHFAEMKKEGYTQGVAAMKKYARHLYRCHINQNDHTQCISTSHGCDCGLAALLEGR